MLHKFLLMIALSVHALSATDDFDLFRSATKDQPHVTSLTFNHRSKLTSLHNLQFFPNLTKLSMTRCLNVRHLMPTIGTLTALTSLKLMDMGIKELKSLRALTKCEVLDIGYNPLDCIDDLTYMSRLRKLSLVYLHRIRDFSKLSTFSSLTYLALDSVFDDEDKKNCSLKFLLPLRSTLQHLSIAYNSQLGNPDLVDVCQLTELRSLDLRGTIWGFTDDDILNLGQLKKLEFLDCASEGFFQEKPDFLFRLPKLKKFAGDLGAPYFPNGKEVLHVKEIGISSYSDYITEKDINDEY